MFVVHNPILSTFVRQKVSIYSHIFLQLCTGGDLFTYVTQAVNSGTMVCEAEAKYIMFQLLKGLKYLHDKLISHRGMILPLSSATCNSV